MYYCEWTTIKNIPIAIELIPPKSIDKYTINLGTINVNTKNTTPKTAAHIAEYAIDLYALTNRYFYFNLVLTKICYLIY